MDTFLSILNKANDVMKQYEPNATFLEFTRNFKLVGTPYIFTFRTPTGTATLKYIEGTGFITPPENHPPLFGVRDIPLLISLTDAQKVVPFTPENVALYWVLYPGADQPYYAFQNATTTAFVGAYDGKLHPQVQTVAELNPNVAIKVPTPTPALAIPNIP